MRLNRGVVLSLLVVFGAGSGCKKTPEVLKSRPLVCSEADGGEGAWSRVILPDEIRGLSGAIVPQYFYSDGQRLGMYYFNNWAEMRPESWDWNVQKTVRDGTFDLDGGYGVYGDGYLVLHTGLDAYTRAFTQRMDVLDLRNMNWRSFDAPEYQEFDDRSYRFMFWTGDAVILWAPWTVEGEGRVLENTELEFTGLVFDPKTSAMSAFPAPIDMVEIHDLKEAHQISRQVHAAWAAGRLYAWGQDPNNPKKNWAYYWEPSATSWVAFNSEDAPNHGARWSTAVDDVGNIFVFGGTDARSDDYIYLREVWRYTISTDSWDEIEVPEWVDPLDGVWMEGKLYVFGQCASGASYDPKSESWAQLPPGNMPSTGKVYTAGGRIMIGQVELHPSLLPYVWIYDPSGEQAPADAGQSIGWGGSSP